MAVRTDRNQINMFSVDYMVKESIEFLQEHEPTEGYYLGYSGGKDSGVIMELAKMAGVKFTAYYSAVGIDPPELVKFIRTHHPEVIFLKPKMTMWEGIRKKKPPLRQQRWCCDVLKKDPGKQIPLKHRIMGQRTEESSKRASRPRIDTFRGNTSYKPIFYWKLWHIWQFHEDYDIPYCDLYDKGFDRLGCVICPFLMGKSPGKKAKRALSMSLWPGVWKAYKHACGVWFEERIEKAGGKLENQKHDDFESYWKGYLNGFE